MTAPPVEYEDGTWRTTADWNPTVNGVTLHIPAGTTTDLASIPVFLRGLPGFATYQFGGVGPALIHDVLYALHGELVYDPPSSTPLIRFTRRAADRIFRQAMRDAGVGRVKRWVAWAAVRLFGWIPFPPSATTLLRNVTTRAAHTMWQTAVAFLAVSGFGWPLLSAVPLAGVLSAVKTWLVPAAERVAGTLYR